MIISIPMARSGDTWQEYSKIVTKEYEVSQEALLTIQNKYGNVEIVSSERNNISFNVEILVEARSQERADDIFKKININFTGTRNQVTAITEYKEESRGWGWGKSNENYKVHYVVKVPKTNELDIDNKYGNVSITDIYNDVKLTLKYGNANIQDIGGELSGYLGYVGSCDVGVIGGMVDLDIAYSNFSAEGMAEGNFVSKYSKMVIEKAGALEIDSKYDTYNIQEALSIENVGKYDNFSIEKVGEIEIETKYTHIKIGELTTSGDFDTGYGGVKIKSLGANFESVIIDSGYTGYSIGVNGGFRLDIDTEYSDTNLPSNMTTTNRDKDSNKLKLQGHYKSSNSGLIQAEMRYGHLDIKE
jgi:hypothetical protein